jgi:hypothetical protein
MNVSYPWLSRRQVLRYERLLDELKMNSLLNRARDAQVSWRTIADLEDAEHYCKLLALNEAYRLAPSYGMEASADLLQPSLF